MFVVPLRRWSPIALLLGAVLAVTGLVAPAQAGTARTVTVRATPTAALRGSSVVVSGGVTNSPIGTSVQVQRKVGSAWKLARTTTTRTASGAYSVSVKLPGIAAVYYYRVFAPSKGSLSSAVSRKIAVIATRPVRATIRRSTTTIYPGDPVTLSGTVAPFVRNTSLVIQRKIGATWRALTTATINSSGRWSRVLRPSATTSYRAVVPRRGLNGSAISGATTVTVLVPPRITTTSLPTAAQAFPYSVQLTRTGGNGAWSMHSGFLPFGLSLNASTGVISGTPTAIETASFTVQFAEAATGKVVMKALSIKVVASLPPSINTTTLPDATKRSPYSAQLSKTGANGTWSLLSGTLPGGISLNASTGEISGTPTLSGTSPFTVKFTEDQSGLTDTQDLTLKVIGVPPTITTTSLGDGTRTIAYSTQLAKTGGAGTWSHTGTLPPGVQLASNGLISGTPTTEGDFSFTAIFTESDADALSDTQALAIHVNAPNAPVITTTSLPDGTENQAYAAQLTANEAGTWALGTGSLPDGVSLNSAGAFSGTSTTPGDFPFTVVFTSTATSLTSNASLSIHITHVGPTITTTTLPDATQGIGYNATLTKTGNPGTWSVDSGSLPAGLNPLNANTGLISGVPTVSGDFAFTVKFTETGSGLSDTQALNLHVIAGTPPTITTTFLNEGVKGTAYSATLTKTGNPGTWSVTGLPTGLTLTPSTGLISGTPTQSGNFTLTITYTEAASTLAATKQLNLHIAAQSLPVVQTDSLPDGKVGVAYSGQLSTNAGLGQWSVPFGSLPPGLSVNPGSGAITGTPTTAGDYTFTVRYATLLAGSDDRVLSIHVAP